MLQIRPAEERGHSKLAWLDSHFTFSFDQYYDSQHMHFRSLRVINEDVIAPAQGFPMHPHRDMEILTWILEGALEHRDSTGGSGVIRPGELQHMTAGRGVTHSEFNHSQVAGVHFLQIWIKPALLGIAPSYEQKHFDAFSKNGKLRLVASSDGREGSVTIHQDAYLYAATLDGADRAVHKLQPGRRAYVHVVRGRVTVNGHPLEAGDALKATHTGEIALEAGKGGEVLLFDLA